MNTNEFNFSDSASTILINEFKKGFKHMPSSAKEVDRKLFELLMEIDVTRGIKNNSVDYKNLLLNGITLLSED